MQKKKQRRTRRNKVRWIAEQGKTCSVFLLIIMSIHIQISPMLLKSVASLYTDPHRVVMEYIDNAFDAAENFYDYNIKAYSRPIEITVTFDGKSYDYARLLIKDNCTGINNLLDLVTKVGSSSKLKDESTNGQFGFGIYSFLAICENLLIQTRLSNSDIINRVELNSKMFETPESEEFNIVSEVQNISGFQIDQKRNDCWTIFRLEGFSKQSIKELNPKTLKKEIENHFELILNRKNISVKIIVRDGKEYLCQPFNYDKYDGDCYNKILDSLEKFKSKKFKSKEKILLKQHKVEIFLKVSKGRILDRKPVFVVKGRRIAEVSDVKAFRTTSKGSIWSHPNVTGYVDVTGVLEPKISRDDFRPSVIEKALFHTLANLESEIKEFITNQLKLPSSSEYNGLQEYLSKTLKKLSQNKRFHNILKFETGMNFNSEIGKGKDEIKDKITLNAPKRIYNPEIEEKEINKKNIHRSSSNSTDTDITDNVSVDLIRNNHLTSNDYLMRKATVVISTSADSESKNNQKNINRTQNRIEGISIIIDCESTPPLDNNDKPLRSTMIDNKIIIYKNHSMFQDRTKDNNFGVQIINSELIFYIAMEIMTQFKTLIYNETKNEITDMSSFFNNISEGVYLFIRELKPLEGKNLSDLTKLN